MNNLQKIKEEARKKFDEFFWDEEMTDFEKATLVKQKDFIDSLITKSYEKGEKEASKIF